MNIGRMILLVCAAAAATGVTAASDTSGFSAAPSLTVAGSIVELKADAGRAIVLAEQPKAPDEDCFSHSKRVQVLVWNHSTRKTLTVLDTGLCQAGGVEAVWGVTLAGDKAAYVYTEGGFVITNDLVMTPLATGRSSSVATGSADIIGNPHGDGGLLAYDARTNCDSNASVGDIPYVPCPEWVWAGELLPHGGGKLISDEIRLAPPERRVIATSDHALALLSVGGGRVVVRESAGPVLVFSPMRSSSNVIATYQYKPGEVLAATTDGRTLAVLRKGVLVGGLSGRPRVVLEVIPLPGSGGTRTILQLPDAASYGPDRPASCKDLMPPCATPELRLTDLDGHIVVYIHEDAVVLVDFTTGKTVTVARPAMNPVNAQLEPDGLYIAAGNSLTFTPRAAVEQRLGR